MFTRRTILGLLLALLVVILLGRLSWAQQGATIQLTITVSNGVLLDWNASTGSDPIAGYNVYRGPSSSGPWTKLTASRINQLDYTDQTVASKQSYSYYVTAVDNSNVESAPSNIVTGTIP